MAQTVKNLPAVWETQVQSLGQEDPLEKGMATLSSILARRTLWTEDPSGLQSMRSQRVTLKEEREEYTIKFRRMCIQSNSISEKLEKEPRLLIKSNKISSLS